MMMMTVKKMTIDQTGDTGQQKPEWATDKQIVPPHTMIEEHCLQNAEDDTGRDVFATLYKECGRY